MTYLFDNQQYVAIAMGPNIIAFGLPESLSNFVAPGQGSNPDEASYLCPNACGSEVRRPWLQRGR